MTSIFDRNIRNVGTLGPVSSDEAIIRALEAEIDQPFGLFADFQGPKLRIGRIEGGRMPLEPGSAAPPRPRSR
jgi:pyruvate kinase